MDKIDKPLVSVLMPIYNCEHTLEAAIDSIIMQTYSNWELIVCNDCSTDKSYAILHQYKKRLKDKMIILKNRTNSRIAYTLNHCLQYAQGEYIARMDGDDLSIPDRLEKQVCFLMTHPEYDLVGSQMISFDATGDKEIRGVKEIPQKSDMKKNTPFCHATILCHSYVYKKLDGYTVSDKIIQCEDVDLWFRFFEKGFKGYNIQEPLYKVREDREAYKRRTFKHSWQASIVLFNGFRRLDFPFSSYIFVLKPIISCFIPDGLKKYIRNRKRDKTL